MSRKPTFVQILKLFGLKKPKFGTYEVLEPDPEEHEIHRVKLTFGFSSLRIIVKDYRGEGLDYDFTLSISSYLNYTWSMGPGQDVFEKVIMENLTEKDKEWQEGAIRSRQGWKYETIF